MSNQKGETMNHILSECKMLAQKEYKERQESIARLVHWKLCCKYDMNRSEKWYKHQSALIPKEEVEEAMKALKATADGNCLFNSEVFKRCYKRFLLTTQN